MYSKSLTQGDCSRINAGSGDWTSAPVQALDHNSNSLPLDYCGCVLKHKGDSNFSKSKAEIQTTKSTLAKYRIMYFHSFSFFSRLRSPPPPCPPVQYNTGHFFSSELCICMSRLQVKDVVFNYLSREMKQVCIYNWYYQAKAKHLTLQAIESSLCKEIDSRSSKILVLDYQLGA